MDDYKVISADSHVVETPDLYTTRIDPKFRDRAPRLERRKSPEGEEYDTWCFDGEETGGIANFAQVGLKYQDLSLIKTGALWENVTKAGYDPHEMVKGLDQDGVWGAIIQPSVGLRFYKLPDSELISAICWAYNDWVTDFCKPYPDRLKPIGCLNVDDVEEGCRDMVRCANLGFVGVFIPVYPLPDRPYSDPMYERLWWTAQDLDMPLLMHVGAVRNGIPGCELALPLNEITAGGAATTAHWVQHSLATMIFAGVFDSYPRLKVVSVEHEMGWIPHWLKQMDYVYHEKPIFSKGWKSKEGMLPSEFWQRNMSVEFMEDRVGVRLRDIIGVDNIMWGNDYPHADGTWPESQQFLDKVFAGTSGEDRRKITSQNAAKLFKFDV